MKLDINDYVNQCKTCIKRTPVEHATLFQIMIAPKWSNYIVDYLNHTLFPENMSKTRIKAIETEAQVYQLIGNQLYKRCKDNQLRLCVSEIEYLSILQETHSGITGGHFSAKTGWSK